MTNVPARSSGPAGDEKVAAGAWWVNYERSAVGLGACPAADDATAEPRSIDVDAVTARILDAADRCAEARAEMDAFLKPYEERGAAAAAILHPAFRELVRNFASAFTVLTELVDPLQVAGRRWRQLIADPRLLVGLDAGLAAANRCVEARAVKKFFRQNSEFLAQR